jgi:hypothetical protein
MTRAAEPDDAIHLYDVPTSDDDDDDVHSTSTSGSSHCDDGSPLADPTSPEFLKSTIHLSVPPMRVTMSSGESEEARYDRATNRRHAHRAAGSAGANTMQLADRFDADRACLFSSMIRVRCRALEN